MEIKISVPDMHIKDLLVGAFEGGSNYWYQNLEIIKQTSRLGNVSDRFYDDLFTNGFTLTDETTGKSHKVLPVDLKRALEMMASQHYLHFGDVIKENSDAETADVFLQLAVFKKVIYG